VEELHAKEEAKRLLKNPHEARKSIVDKEEIEGEDEKPGDEGIDKSMESQEGNETNGDMPEDAE
jgi:hypothetical protein